MTSPSIHITWSLAEAEAAHAGFPVITPAHLWISHCKAVDLSVSDVLGHGDDELQAMEGQVEADFREMREAIRAVGLSPKLLRRAIRVELGRGPGAGARPLHRSDALRAVFKRGAALATEDGRRLRPLHLLVALAEQNEPVVAAAIVKLGHDAVEVMRVLSARPAKAARKKPEQKRDDGKPIGKKESALQRFGRDLTELAAQGALPPLIGRREEMLRITQILMQSRKNNLILVGERELGRPGSSKDSRSCWRMANCQATWASLR